MKTILLAIAISLSGVSMAQNSPSVNQIQQTAGNLKNEVNQGVQQAVKAADAPIKKTKKAIKRSGRKSKGRIPKNALKGASIGK